MRREAAGLLVAGQSRLQDVTNEVVRAEDFTGLQVFYHPVGKPGDMARSLEHRSGGHDGRVNFEHVLLDNEMLPPLRNDIALERRARRTVVV